MTMQPPCAAPGPGTGLQIQFDAIVRHADDDLSRLREGAYLMWPSSTPVLVLVDEKGRAMRIDADFLRGWLAVPRRARRPTACVLLASAG